MAETDLPVSRLRKKHKKRGPRQCSRCRKNLNGAELAVQLRDARPEVIGKAGTSVTRTRALCASCGAAVFEALVEVLDAEANGAMPAIDWTKANITVGTNGAFSPDES